MRRPEVGDDRAVHVASALVFLASAAGTAAWCGSMSAMPGMEMPGGWVMSMTWMRMPEQGWLDAAAVFIGMWSLMMMAMMTPVLAPELARSRRAGARWRAIALFALAYFAAWTALGLALFPVGVAFAELAMSSEGLSRASPALAGAAVMAAGALQFTRWKARQLACCRHRPERCQGARPNYPHALRAGWRLGMRCIGCCAGLTATLLAMGVMELWAMALVTLAISAERLASSPGVARGVGAGLLLAGALLVLRGGG